MNYKSIIIILLVSLLILGCNSTKKADSQKSGTRFHAKYDIISEEEFCDALWNSKREYYSVKENDENNYMSIFDIGFIETVSSNSFFYNNISNTTYNAPGYVLYRKADKDDKNLALWYRSRPQPGPPRNKCTYQEVGFFIMSNEGKTALVFSNVDNYLCVARAIGDSFWFGDDYFFEINATYFKIDSLSINFQKSPFRTINKKKIESEYYLSDEELYKPVFWNASIDSWQKGNDKISEVLSWDDSFSCNTRMGQEGTIKSKFFACPECQQYQVSTNPGLVCHKPCISYCEDIGYDLHMYYINYYRQGQYCRCECV